jgi:hypothetical protein
MGNDLHARVQTLAQPRRSRIGVSDRWDSSGGTDRDNHLTCYSVSAALLIPANSTSLCARAPNGRAAEQRDELAALHSITSSAMASSPGGKLRLNAFAVYYARICTETNRINPSAPTRRRTGEPGTCHNAHWLAGVVTLHLAE